MIKLKLVVFGLFFVFLTSCSTYEQAEDHFYLNPDKDLSSVGRVVLVELGNNSNYPSTSTDVTESLFQALQKQQLFGVTVVGQNNSAWHNLELEPGSTLTLEQLSAVRKSFKCDALLLGTITGFEPFPHLSMGLQLRLLDLKDGQLLWALEQIWDTADKTTEKRIKKYYSRNILGINESLQVQLGTVSSLKFIKFVTYEVAETLKTKNERVIKIGFSSIR